MLAAATLAATLAWSAQPPGLHPVDAPQFVAVTFDDNFVSGIGDPSGGMTWATDFLRELKNPAGASLAATFDGAPVRTSFYDNCVYLQDEGTRQSWITAREDGHEIANHTVNHANGASYTEQNWSDEIAPCTAALSNPEGGIGIAAADVRGFRAPFLAYSTALFPTLLTQGLKYDSSIQSCWSAAQDGGSCGWPHTLDQGSPDANDLMTKFGTPSVPPTAGLWEVTASALFVPPDELAGQYGISPGLRARIPTDMAAPSYYDAATGRIAGLDITLFVDAGLSAAEVLATLKYTLDLRLAGNRAPFVFIAHTHVYASNYGAAPHAPSAEERQGAIVAFVEYALSKSMVRMRPVIDILSWMSAPAPLGGVVTMPLGGAGGGGAAAGGAAGSAGMAGAGLGVGGMLQPASGAPSNAGTGGVGALTSSPSETPAQVSCGCRTPLAGRSAHGLMALLGLAAAMVWRRRSAQGRLIST
jgi:MYXO-CTERM domain-containing protein